MKIILSIVDHSLIALALLALTDSALAQTPAPAVAVDHTAPAAIYYCVPMYAWDTGYNVAINYDELKNQFRAKVYAVDFFGEKPIINEAVQLDIAKGGDAPGCVFSFSQARKSPGHSVAFRDFAHHEFAMELSIQGQKVDGTNRTLRCQVASWFVEQFKACH